jgi:hypothetical protein
VQQDQNLPSAESSRIIVEMHSMDLSTQELSFLPEMGIFRSRPEFTASDRNLPPETDKIQDFLAGMFKFINSGHLQISNIQKQDSNF